MKVLQMWSIIVMKNPRMNDLVGKVAEGAKLTRRSVARVLSGIKPDTFAMFKNNPEEFITKVIRLINEQKATMIVEQITYNKAEGSYDANIFTAEKNTDFSRAYCAKKNYQRLLDIMESL